MLFLIALLLIAGPAAAHDPPNWLDLPVPVLTGAWGYKEEGYYDRFSEGEHDLVYHVAFDGESGLNFMGLDDLSAALDTAQIQLTDGIRPSPPWPRYYLSVEGDAIFRQPNGQINYKPAGTWRLSNSFFSTPPPQDHYTLTTLRYVFYEYESEDDLQNLLVRLRICQTDLVPGLAHRDFWDHVEHLHDWPGQHCGEYSPWYSVASLLLLGETGEPPAPVELIDLARLQARIDSLERVVAGHDAAIKALQDAAAAGSWGAVKALARREDH